MIVHDQSVGEDWFPFATHPPLVAVTSLCTAIVLFDEVRGRVFVLRDDAIADAREFAVAPDLASPRLDRSAAQRRRLRRAWIQERATQTAGLLIDLHAAHRFDCVFVAGPPWAPVLLWQKLPADLRIRLSGALNLAVGSGETAILRAALPAVAMTVRS